MLHRSVCSCLAWTNHHKYPHTQHLVSEGASCILLLLCVLAIMHGVTPINTHTHTHTYTAESVGGRFQSLAWSLNTSQAKALEPLASSRRAGDMYMSGKRDREGGDEAGDDHLKAPRRFHTVPLRHDQLVCLCVCVCGVFVVEEVMNHMRIF